MKNYILSLSDLYRLIEDIQEATIDVLEGGEAGSSNDFNFLFDKNFSLDVWLKQRGKHAIGGDD